MEFISESEKDTETLAARLAQGLQPGAVLCLHGDLGTGKSVLCRALIRVLSDDSTLEVPSPTFTLVQTYETARGMVYHFDLYRLEDPEEIWEIGWEEALSDGIALIEWPEKAGPYLPNNAKAITLEQLSETKRRITIDE